MINVDTGTEELLCSIDQRVATITLNKPHKKNALGDVLTPALRQVLLDLEDNDQIGCIMLTGSGDAFCSGGDVTGMGGGSSSTTLTKQERIDQLTHAQRTLTQRLYEHPKITIAALPGAAAGAGLSIALACDLRVASENAFITTAFANIGLSGDYGSSWFLTRLIGLAQAKELLFLSERINASDAMQMGIVNRVYPHTSFRQQAFDYARRIALGPTQALGRMKINLHKGLGQELSESLALEAKHLVESMGEDESKEAITAFLEKRTPNFH
jgi:enoyl-CoA hydratase/carnithine racemase